jgi:Bacterial regulatory protein, Fis family
VLVFVALCSNPEHGYHLEMLDKPKRQRAGESAAAENSSASTRLKPLAFSAPQPSSEGPRGTGSRGPYRAKPKGYQRGDRKLKAADAPRVLDALRRAHGIRTSAAHLLNVSPVTLYSYLKEHELKDQLQQVDEETLDAVEDRLCFLIGNNDVRTITFYLERRGRARGWNRRDEMSGMVQHNVSAVPSTSQMIEVLEGLAAERAKLAALAAPAPAIAAPDVVDAVAVEITAEEPGAEPASGAGGDSVDGSPDAPAEDGNAPDGSGERSGKP